MTALADALEAAGNDKAVRVIILAANGPVFCAGHNLKELQAARTDPAHAADRRARAYFERIMTACSALMQSITAHPKPIIAEIDGVATAADASLSPAAIWLWRQQIQKFATPGVHIGLFCSTPMVALSRKVASSMPWKCS